VGKRKIADSTEFITGLKDPGSATAELLRTWSNIPLLLMLDTDWEKGPLVLIGLDDYMMWPLVPPGSVLQLDPTLHTIDEGRWSEFDRPIYLIEFNARFYCCYAQRKGRTVLLISHAESPAGTIVRVPARHAIVRGRLTPVFKPLATSSLSTLGQQEVKF